MDLHKPFNRAVAKALIFMMVFHCLPFWPLSRAYSVEYSSKQLARQQLWLSLFSPSEAEAATPRVICVPILPRDLRVPHETWTGEPTILKGVARDDDGDLVGGRYAWDFGDGSPNEGGLIEDEDNLSITHTYSTDFVPGTLIIARLHVTDLAGASASDEYRIFIKEKTLDTEVNKAIDDALWWLYTKREVIETNQCRWRNCCVPGLENYYANTTASAVQAYEINGHLETGDPNEDPYVLAVRGGINYLLSGLEHYQMSDQGVDATGEPADPEGSQLEAEKNRIGLSTEGGYEVYQLGTIMDALVASGRPTARALSDPNDDTVFNVSKRPYKAIVQDMADMYAWGQTDEGNFSGGWRYDWNSGADLSASQWAAIGIIAAERNFGITLPEWVKERSDEYVTWVFDDISSSFAYRGAGSIYTDGRQYSMCASGMVMLTFEGYDHDDYRWKACENNIADNWAEFIDPCRPATYYSYFAFAKAMRLALPEPVTSLSATGLDWYGDKAEGLARVLVDRQQTEGSWPFYVGDDWEPYASTGVGEQTFTAWNTIILTRTLFEAPPVAIIEAAPNPTAIAQQVSFNASGSYHKDPVKEIVEYRWDFDSSDGIDFDHPDDTGSAVDHAYSQLGEYSVSLRVVDNSTPVRINDATVVVYVTPSPHPPTAVMSGPYIATVGENIRVDGSSSYDIDEANGDSITLWEWEAPLTAPYGFNEASEEIASLPSFGAVGIYDIALQVTDNTATVFPGSGQPNLTDVDYGQVNVYELGITDLAVRPKDTKCQLTWTDEGAALYEIFRSKVGPNHGFEQIGSTASTYSTFLDYSIKIGVGYWYRLRYKLNSDIFLSNPVSAYSAGKARSQPPIITSRPVTQAQEGELYTYDVAAVDPESTTLTYLLDQAPAGMVIDSATGEIVWTPSDGQFGKQDIAVRVQDETFMSAMQFYPVVVLSRPNMAPIAHAGGPYKGIENIPVTFTASNSSDPDGDSIIDYHWVFGGTVEAHGPQVTHTFSDYGYYTVTLYVTDERGRVGQAESTCLIKTPDVRPQAILQLISPEEGSRAIDVNIRFSASQSTNGNPDDILTACFDFGDGSDPACPSNFGIIVEHKYQEVGQFTVTLTIDDNRGEGPVTDEVIINILPPNVNPVALCKINGENPVPGAEYHRMEDVLFDAGSSYDPDDGQVVDWDWTFKPIEVEGDNPGWIYYNDAPSISHYFELKGHYQVELMVEDNRGGVNIINIKNLVIVQAMTRIPKVIDEPLAEAERLIQEAYLQVDENILEEFSFTVPVGYVIDQLPLPSEPGELIGEDDCAPIALTVSKGPEKTIVPDIGGRTYPEVLILFNDSNLKLELGAVELEENSDVTAGTVFEQIPAAGDEVVINTLVNVKVSLGSLTEVPDVSNGQMSYETAIAAIEGAFLQVGAVSYEYSEAISDGIVFLQNPVAGAEVNIGSSVEIVISRGANIGKITSPDFGDELSHLTEIVGTVQDNYLVRWQLDYAVYGEVDHNNLSFEDSDYVTIAEGTECIQEGLLATLDTTTLPNNAYVLRLLVENDKHFLGTGLLVNVVGKKFGQFKMETTDLLLPMNGIPINVTRIYDTLRSKKSGDFGYGWRLRSMDADIQESSLGFRGGFTGEQAFIQGANRFESTRVYITTPDGRRIGFSFEPESAGSSLLFGPSYYPRFTPDPGVSEKLETDCEDDPLITISPTGKAVTVWGGLTWAPHNYFLTTRDGLKYKYTRKGRLLKIEDRNKNKVAFHDDGIVYVPHGSDNPSQWIVIERSEDEDGNKGPIEKIYILTEEADPPAITYEYDETTGDLLSVTDQEGNVTSYTYYTEPKEASHYLKDVSDPLGRVTKRYEYDENGRLIGTEEEGTDVVYEISWSYDPENLISTYTNGRGKETIYNYNERGNIIRIIAPLLNETRYQYLDVNNPDKVSIMTDARNNKTYFLYDENGFLKFVWDALFNLTRYTYNNIGLVETVTDPLGRVTQYGYDGKGHLAGLIDDLGESIYTAEYDDQGRMKWSQDAKGNLTEYIYEGLCCGRAKSITKPNGNVEVYDYDDFGHVTEFTDEAGNITIYDYDDTGRLEYIDYPNGEAHYYEYLGNNLNRVTDAFGRSVSRIYDARGNITSLKDFGENETLITYNGNNKPESITDPQGNITQFVYDDLDRLVDRIDPFGEVTHHSYDKVGNLIETIDREGRKRTFEYDSIYRKTGEKWYHGKAVEGEFSYTYDKAGRMLTAEGPVSAYQYTYDPNLDLLLEMNNIGTSNMPETIFTYEYDFNGNVTKIIDNNNFLIESSYDEMDQLSKRLWKGPGMPSIQAGYPNYDRGRKALVKRWKFIMNIFPAVVGKSDYTYDEMGRYDTIIHSKGATDLVNYDYYFDAAGQLQVAIHHDEWSFYYPYDELGQLGGVWRYPELAETYTYDVNGNRLSSHLHGSNYVTGEGNRIHSDGRYEYGYDKEGNITTRTDIGNGKVTKYTYDFRNRMTAVELEDSKGSELNRVEYIYDVLDRRIGRIEDGEAIYTVYAGKHAWADFDDTGSVKARYLFGDKIDEIIARYCPGEGTVWYLTDNLGTVRDLTDLNGNIIANIDYDAYGNPIINGSDLDKADRFMFTGREYDTTTGLYYYRSRYYDPEIGRFMSEDRIGFAGADVNLYRYVNNVPVLFTDPLGEEGLLLHLVASTTATVAFNAANREINCADPSLKELFISFGGFFVTSIFLPPALFVVEAMVIGGLVGGVAGIYDLIVIRGTPCP